MIHYAIVTLVWIGTVTAACLCLIGLTYAVVAAIEDHRYWIKRHNK